MPAGAIGNGRGLSSPAFSRDLTVNAPIGVTKGVSPQVIPVNRPSRMTIVISNRSANSDLPITEFEDVFPLGMVLSDPPNAQVSCTPDGNGVVTNGDLTDLDGNPVAGGALGLLLRDAVAGAQWILHRQRRRDRGPGGDTSRTPSPPMRSRIPAASAARPPAPPCSPTGSSRSPRRSCPNRGAPGG